ncbi:MAG: hypothetical protein PVJ49_17795 [Acidobacteriota bacterium]
MSGPRFLHRAWAMLRGYAWIPCPICKKRFGSHERRPGNELWITGRDSVAVCPRCADEAARRNAEKGYPLVERPDATSAGDTPINDA